MLRCNICWASVASLELRPVSFRFVVITEGWKILDSRSHDDSHFERHHAV